MLNFDLKDEELSHSPAESIQECKLSIFPIEQQRNGYYTIINVTARITLTIAIARLVSEARRPL